MANIRYNTAKVGVLNERAFAVVMMLELYFLRGCMPDACVFESATSPNIGDVHADLSAVYARFAGRPEIRWR
jgi:hypothetical protein